MDPTQSPRAVIENLISALREPSRTYKRDVIDQALALKKELTPQLLDILRTASENPEDYLDSDDDSLAYVALLLSYWEVESALPYFLAFAHWDEEILEDLWGDMITESFATFLYRTGRSHPELLKEVADDGGAYLWIRLAALDALNWMVISNEVSRGEMLEFYRQSFRNFFESPQGDPEWGEMLIHHWVDLYPPLVDLQIIKDAYARGWIEPMIVGRYHELEAELRSSSWEEARAKLAKELQTQQEATVHDSAVWWSGENSEEVSVKLVAALKQDRAEVLNAYPPENEDPEDRELAQCIQQMGEQKVILSFPSLKAYVAGVVSGLETVPPSVVIGELFKSVDDDAAPFEDKRKATEFFEHFNSLWNRLTDWQPTSQPPLLKPISASRLEKANSTELANILRRRMTEAQQFLRGLDRTGTHWSAIRDENTKAALEWLESYSAEISVRWRKYLHAQESGSYTGTDQMRVLIQLGDKYWPDNFSILYSGLRSQWQNQEIAHAAAANLTPMQALEKIGRNEPCPCGSGKKFKKCCLH